MKVEMVPSTEEYSKQRNQVAVAIAQFVKDAEIPVSGSGFTGNHLFVASRNEYWFETWVRWVDGTRRIASWSHVYADLAEFDRRFGSPDHPDTFGYRETETMESALEGSYDG